jgi:hypothetical protein
MMPSMTPDMDFGMEEPTEQPQPKPKSKPAAAASKDPAPAPDTATKSDPPDDESKKRFVKSYG